MAQILDQHGQPIDRAVLAEPQTAQLGYLSSQYANHPSRGLTPQKLSRILQQAEQGDLVGQCELFEDMEEKDAHLLAEMGKRKRALLTVEWEIVPPRNPSADEQSDADYLKEVIDDIPDLEDVFLNALDGIGKGYSCQEIEWNVVEGQWLPKCISHRPPSWFKTNYFAQDELRLRDMSALGAELLPFGWIKHIHKAKSGYVGRGGLHRVLAWPYLFKNYGVRDLAEFLEIHGLPLRLGTYPSGATDSEKSALLRAVVGMGHNAAGIIPAGMAVEFNEAAKGSSDPHMAMIDWAERSMSKAILGGTLTSQADGKSSTNALGNVHNEVRHDLLESDGRQAGSTMSRDLLYPILALNRGGNLDMRRRPRMVFMTKEAADLEQLSAALPAVVNSGLKVPVAWAYKTFQIPVPKDGEEVLVPVSNPVKPEQLPPERLRGKLPSRFAALLAALQKQPPKRERDELDALVDLLSGDWQSDMGEIVNPILQMVEQADSMEALSAGLAELAGTLEPGAFTEQLAEAMFMGRLYGRAAKNAG